MLCPEHKAEEFPVKKTGRHRSSAKATQKSSLHTPIKLPNHAKPSTAEETSVKWTNNQSSKWVLCGSALDAAGKVQSNCFCFLNQLPLFFQLTAIALSKFFLVK